MASRRCDLEIKVVALRSNIFPRIRFIETRHETVNEPAHT